MACRQQSRAALCWRDAAARRPSPLVLLLMVLRAQLAEAQSSCAAGTADLDSDGGCDQCFSSVPQTRVGFLRQDVSDTLANNAAGCAYTQCFLCSVSTGITITPSGATETRSAPACSSACGCIASCAASSGAAMLPPTFTRTESCPLPPAVADMTIAIATGSAVVGQQASYTCTVGGGAPEDGTATRTCQAGGAWSGTAPTICQIVVTIKAWGGGGAGGTMVVNYGDPKGGAGGYATADYLALPGETLTISVGNKGTYNTNDGFGWPNGGQSGSYSYVSGAGGGASFVETARDSIGVILGAGGGGGGSSGQHGSAGGGGGGGTSNGVVGSGGHSSDTSDCTSACNGVGGNGGAGRSNFNSHSPGSATGGGGSGGTPTGSSEHGVDANGAGGSGDSSYQGTGGGGGGAASSKNVIAGTFSTIDATDQASINTADAHWDTAGSGRGGDGTYDNAVRGRVVLVIRGEATVFDSTGGVVTFVVD